MDRVAATAGVSKRTVYNHFPSKDALFGEILRGLWQRSADAVNLVYRPDQPLRAQLITLLQQKLRLLDDPAFIDLSRVALAEGIHSPARARELISQLGSKEEGTTTWLRAALADGRLAGVGGLRLTAAAGAGQRLRVLAAAHDGPAAVVAGTTDPGCRIGRRDVFGVVRPRVSARMHACGMLRHLPGPACHRPSFRVACSLQESTQFCTPAPC